VLARGAPYPHALPANAVVWIVSPGGGAPQAGGAEQVQQREVALALAGAAVGHAQQPRPLVVGERARLAAADPLGAYGAQLLGLDAEGVGESAQRGEVLGDGCGGPPGALERVAVGAHGLRRDVTRAGVGSEERAERSVHRGVGAPRLRRALAGGDFCGASGEPAGVDELAGDRGGELWTGELELVSHAGQHGQDFGRVRELSLPDASERAVGLAEMHGRHRRRRGCCIATKEHSA
jgi:hypothetical protein